MRGAWTLLLISGMALGQAESPKTKQTSTQAGASEDTRFSQNRGEVGHPSPAQDSSVSAAPAAAPAPDSERQAKDDSKALVIPAGSKIPLSLSQAISTKNAREGDAVYAVTAFPFVVGDRLLVPAGTYVQGKVSRVERAGHGHGRAEILMHFTSLIYPSGYTVMLPGSIENMPGSDSTTVKDKEGTVQHDKNTGKKVEEAAKGGAYGTLAGATAGGLATGSLNGARAGGAAGAAAGIAWALLKRGPDVKLDVGTSIEMQVDRPITLDANRIQMARVVR
jgi:hypothetical protein